MAIISSSNSDFSSDVPKRENRMVDSHQLSKELSPLPDEGLRPRELKDYVGQKALKKILGISIKAAIKREEALDHVLLHGPPGLGKTTMALVLAEELGVKCRITSAPALERPRDIIGLLLNLKDKEILFIDEIHRLTKVAEELLYPAMEDRRLDLTFGKGSTSRVREITLNAFTLIGATTRIGTLSSPLRDRFGLTQRLEFYDLDELELIAERTAKFFKLKLTKDASIEIARRCRGTPRIANRLVRRVRDYATVVEKVNYIDKDLVAKSLKLHGVDRKGLDSMDRRLLSFLVKDHKFGPIGLETLAAALGEDSATLETVIEPYLLQIGFLSRTPRGRVATPLAQSHLDEFED